MNSNEIKNAKLEKSAFGYKAESVENFIKSAYDYAKSLEDQNSVLEKKMAVLAKKIEEYRADESNMKEALLGAQRLGQTVISEANEKANVAIAQANIEAERIIKDAKDEAEKKEKELKLQIASEEKSLLKIKKEVSEFKSKLLTIYKSHLDVITALPEIEKGEAEKPAEPEQKKNDGDENAAEQKKDSKEAKPGFHVNISEDDKSADKPANPNDDKVKENFTAKFGELKFGKNFKE